MWPILFTYPLFSLRDRRGSRSLRSCAHRIIGKYRMKLLVITHITIWFFVVHSRATAVTNLRFSRREVFNHFLKLNDPFWIKLCCKVPLLLVEDRLVLVPFSFVQPIQFNYWLILCVFDFSLGLVHLLVSHAYTRVYPWVLIKFLDLECGGLFEEGAYQIFTIFSKYWVYFITKQLITRHVAVKNFNCSLKNSLKY